MTGKLGCIFRPPLADDCPPIPVVIESEAKQSPDSWSIYIIKLYYHRENLLTLKLLNYYLTAASYLHQYHLIQ